MGSMLTCILFIISVIKVVGLLQWHITSDFQITVPHKSAFQNIHRLLRVTYSFSWMSIATALRRQGYGCSALNLTYMCIQNFPEAWYRPDTGIGGFAWRWLYPQGVQNHLLGDDACTVELCEWLQWWLPDNLFMDWALFVCNGINRQWILGIGPRKIHIH